MRTTTLLLILLAAATPAIADGEEDRPAEAAFELFVAGSADETGLPALPGEAELARAVRTFGDVTLDRVTVSDLAWAAGLVSVAVQERELVRRVGRLSWLLPGLGQFALGENGTGAGILITELVIRAAGAATAFAFLPPQVRIANLNYLQTPISEIEETWKALTPADYLPAIGVQFTVEVLSAIIRGTAARTARASARDAILSGEISFDPEPSFLDIAQ